MVVQVDAEQLAVHHWPWFPGSASDTCSVRSGPTPGAGGRRAAPAARRPRARAASRRSRAGRRRPRRGGPRSPARPARTGWRSAPRPRRSPSSAGAPAPGRATRAARRRSRARAAWRGRGRRAGSARARSPRSAGRRGGAWSEAAGRGSARARRSVGRPARQLHQRLVGEHEARGAVHRLGDLLAPLRRARAPPPARSRSRRASRGSRSYTRWAVRSSVDLLERAALLARPLEPPALAQPLLEALAEREQAAGVVSGVLELLGGERAAVPAR